MEVTTPLLTVEQVAELLGTTPNTVYLLVRRGTLPASKLPGIWWRIAPPDLADFVDAGRNSSSPALAQAS